MIYNLHTYPTPDTFLEDVENDVPNSLKLLLNSIIKKKSALMKKNTKPQLFLLHTP